MRTLAAPIVRGKLREAGFVFDVNAPVGDLSHVRPRPRAGRPATVAYTPLFFCLQNDYIMVSLKLFKSFRRNAVKAVGSQRLLCFCARQAVICGLLNRYAFLPEGTVSDDAFSGDCDLVEEQGRGQPRH